MSLGHIQNLTDGRRQSSPGVGFRFKLLAATLRQLVKLGFAIILGRSPFRLDPSASLQSVQCRVKGALSNLERIAGNLLYALGDCPAVLRPQRNRFENQNIEGSLWKIYMWFSHWKRVPFYFDKSLPPLLSKYKGRLFCLTDRDVISDNFAILHYELNTFKFSDVGDRVSGDSNEIGEFARFDGADEILPTQ